MDNVQSITQTIVDHNGTTFQMVFLARIVKFKMSKM